VRRRRLVAVDRSDLRKARSPRHVEFPALCGFDFQQPGPRSSVVISGLDPVISKIVMPGSNPGMTNLSRNAMRPSFARASRPTEGVGNARCPPHPQPRVGKNWNHTSIVTTGSPESPGIPARNGFNGFLRALPGDRALLPPSPATMRSIVANLTPASGRQDHTTSPSAK
jgi:hypothetical protein